MRSAVCVSSTQFRWNGHFFALLVGAEERKPRQRSTDGAQAVGHPSSCREACLDVALTYEVQDHFLMLESKLKIAHLTHYLCT